MTGPADTMIRAVEEIRPILEEHAPQSEADRRLADASYDAMLQAGLFRMLSPRAFGGMELHPVEAYKVWEAVSRIDSAAGWNLQIANAVASFAVWLPPEGGEEVFGDGPDVIAAGTFFPPAAATRVDGGWRVTGRTPFASGAHRARWFLIPIIELDGVAPKMDSRTGEPVVMAAFLPRADIRLIDTWQTMGMRGTFSVDAAVNDTFIPRHRAGVVGPIQDPPPAFAGPLYRLAPWPGVHGETSVSLGIAGSAIAKLIDLAGTTTPAFGTTVLRDREIVQHHVARATALVDAGREYLHAAASEAYAAVAQSGSLSQREKVRCQLSACFAAEACAQAVDLVHEAAGTSAIRIEPGLERHFRDIHTLTQHASKSYCRYPSVGKMLFGLAPDWFVLKQ